MKKWTGLLFALVLLLAACGNNDNKESSKAETKSYTMDDGSKVDIPKEPKRVAVVAASYAGGLKHLGTNIVAVNEQVDSSSILKEKFKGVEKISDDDVEKVAKTKPDLILVFKEDKNIKKYQKIAPTVVFDYSKHKYLDQQKMLGKLVGKEDEANKWIASWKSETAKDAKEIKNKIGEDATVSIFDEFDKKLYTYGDNWGRGSEVLYQAFDLNMPKALDELTKKEGWAEIPKEKMEQYAGDYIVSTRDGKSNPAYTETSLWKNLPAVQNNQVFEVPAATYWYNDPYSLDFIRKDLKEKFLK